MSTSERILKNTGFLYIKMGITVFISLYTTRLILNALGASDFGVFGVVGGAISMLGFLNGAMAGATQRFMNYYQGKGDSFLQLKIFNNSVLLHWGIALLVVILLELAGLFYFSGILNIESDRMVAAKWIYQFAIISTLFTIITVPYDAAINAHENMLYYSIVGILESILKLAIAFVVVYSSADKLILYGLFMALLTVLMLVVKQIYCRINYEECQLSLSKYYDRTVIKELTGFAGWNFFGSAGSIVGNWGGSIIINNFFGTKINAAENVGNQLRGQMLAFSNNMLKALNPVITKKEGAGSRQDMLKFALTGSKLSYQIFAIFAIPFLVETPYIMKIWLKNVPEWTECFSRFLMVIALAEQLTITLGTMLGAVNRIREMNVFNSCAYLIPLLIYVIFFSLGAEPYWLYIIILINYGVVINSFKVYQCKKYCGLNISTYLSSVVVPCVLISVISFLTGYSLHLFLEEGIVRLILSLTLTSMTYIILSFLYGYNDEEQTLIRTLVHNTCGKIIHMAK